MKQGPLGNLIDQAGGVIKGIGRGVLPGLFRQQQMASAPASVGVVIPRAYFGFAGKPQAMADYSTDRAVRIMGCGLFTSQLAWNGTNNGAFRVEPPYTAPSGYYWRPLIPATVDPRLDVIASAFQFYAFRVLRFSNIPSAGTSISANIAFGISQDATQYLTIPEPTQTQVLEENTSTMAPVWTPATFEYKHTGNKLWSTDPNEPGTVDNAYQALLAAVLSRVSSSGDPASPGQLFVEYVLDLYEPQPVAANPLRTADLPPFGVHIGAAEAAAAYARESLMESVMRRLTLLEAEECKHE